MAAFLLPIGLYTVWTILGLAAISLALPRRRGVFNLLLAPIVGAALLQLPLYVLNIWGLPIRTSGLPLTIVLGLGAAILLRVRRPAIPVRRFLPFVAVLIAALFLVGWPLLRFGFDWMSMCNDDMANYSLGSHYLLTHGMHDLPTMPELLEGKDPSRWFWSMYVAGSIRAGGEVLIAWTASLTGLSTQQAFMPVILALHLCLVSAVGALAYNCGGRRAGLLASVLIAASALNALGTVNQLSAQVGGLAYLCACTPLILRPFRHFSRGFALRHGLFLGYVSAGFLLHYPEAVPFLGVAFVIYTGWAWWRKRVAWRPTLLVAGLASLIVVVLLNRYALGAFRFILEQSEGGAEANEFLRSLFHHYLVPSGQATLWGFQTTLAELAEPKLSIAIVLGAICTMVVVAGTLWLARRGQAVAVLSLVVLLVGVTLLIKQAPFGLYKLAMFSQPIFLATLALTWARLPRLRRCAFVFLVGLAGANLLMQGRYVRYSLDTIGQSDFVNGSGAGVTAELRERLMAQPPGRIVFDTNSNYVARLAGLYSGRSDLHTPFALVNLGILNFGDSAAEFESSRQLYKRLDAQRKQLVPKTPFRMHDPDGSDRINVFEPISTGWVNDYPEDAWLLGTRGQHTILNRWHHPPSSSRDNFFLRPIREVHNHLIFVSSELGPHVYFCGEHTFSPAIYFHERDVYFTGQSMAALGRDLLFEVINPDAEARFLVELTASLKHDGENRLPPLVAIGEGHVRVPFEGRGTGRVVSPPLKPQRIGGRYYVALDMGVDGTRFTNRPGKGLGSLWNKGIQRDRRLITTFGRNIALLSEDQYQGFRPPACVNRFPQDLSHPHLEFSGIYEDGWVAESCFACLAHPGGTVDLVIQGEYLRLADGAETEREMRVIVDGKEISRRSLRPGEFEVRCPVVSYAQRKRIELRFSSTSLLPGDDGRPASVRLDKFGFVPPPEKLGGAGKELPDAGASGIHSDSWVEARASCRLTHPEGASQLELRGQLPMIDDREDFTTELTLLVDGQEVGRKELAPGDFTWRVPVRRVSGQSTIELRFSRTQPLPAPDNRQVGARLLELGFVK